MKTVNIPWKSVLWIVFAGNLLVLTHLAVNSSSGLLPLNALSTDYKGSFKTMDVHVSKGFQSHIVFSTELSISEIHRNGKTFPCEDVSTESSYSQRGNFWVMRNYFKATATFRCDLSVTYTTHAEWTFLDNLIPLLKRWQGPLSLALYSPGKDFYEAFNKIQYLRECENSHLVKKFVTFHVFFDQGHVPFNITFIREPGSFPVNCSKLAKYRNFGERFQTYRKAHNLTYPVNLARNIAREMATTHYVLPADIELYPSPDFIQPFLEMIRRNDSMLQRSAPKVFVLPHFELQPDVKVLPSNKRQLIDMLENKSAVIFHKEICDSCHRTPRDYIWLAAPIRHGMRITHFEKREKPHAHWEPFYVETKSEPMYDERLTWEGQRDKMIQGYILCLLDYEYHILDNAFLVHKPGIKDKKERDRKAPPVVKQLSLINENIIPELVILYGNRTDCIV